MSKINLGSVIGPQGPKGQDANNFAFDVEDGELFVSYEDQENSPEFKLDENGHLVKVVNGTVVDLGNVRGPKGDQGPAGSGGSTELSDPKVWVTQQKIMGQVDFGTKTLASLGTPSFSADFTFSDKTTIDNMAYNGYTADTGNAILLEMRAFDDSNAIIPIDIRSSGGPENHTSEISSTIEVTKISGVDYSKYTKSKYNCFATIILLTSYFD